MNFKDLSKLFHKNGYVYIEKFFNAALMNDYQDEICNHFKENNNYKHDESFIEKSKTDVVPWFPQIEGRKKFNVLEKNKKLCDLTEEVLGSGWKSLYCMVMYSNKSSNGQAWHQDCSPNDDGIFNLNRLVYSMDINNSTGGEICVIPGSHKKGMIPRGSATDEIVGSVTISPLKGSLLLLHGHTWHKVLPILDNVRVSTNYRCVPKNTPNNVTDVAVYRNMLFRFSDGKILTNRV